MKFACVALLCLALASTVSAQTAAPAGAASLADALKAAPNNTLSTLKAALDAAGLMPALRNTSLVWTVFAPTNEAFATAVDALGTDTTTLLADQALLTTILSYHVVPGVAALSADLSPGQLLPTLLGPELAVSFSGGNVTIYGASNSANVIAADIPAGMSVIHVIDAVLIPPMDDTNTTSDGMTTPAADTTNSTAAGSTDNSTAAGTAAPLSGNTTTTGANGGAAPVATSAAQPMVSLGLVSGAAVAIAVLGSLLL